MNPGTQTGGVGGHGHNGFHGSTDPLWVLDANNAIVVVSLTEILATFRE